LKVQAKDTCRYSSCSKEPQGGKPIFSNPRLKGRKKGREGGGGGGSKTRSGYRYLPPVTPLIPLTNTFLPSIKGATRTIRWPIKRKKERGKKEGMQKTLVTTGFSQQHNLLEERSCGQRVSKGRRGGKREGEEKKGKTGGHGDGLAVKPVVLTAEFPCHWAPSRPVAGLIANEEGGGGGEKEKEGGGDGKEGSSLCFFVA